MYTLNDERITFSWAEGTSIRENLHELLAGCREAADRSIRVRDSIRVHLPHFADVGSIEGRSRPGGMPPRTSNGIEILSVVSTDPYYLVQFKEMSPYYHISIPGLLQLMDADLLAINAEFAPYVCLICNEIFNCSMSTMNIAPLPAGLRPYINMPRTANLLSKRPRVPKTVDFAPIFLALFGEKIATVIMKEIK